MHQRIRHILNNLDTLREDLLALSDDIWLNIEHNDSTAVQRGAEFKIAFNDAALSFSGAASKLSRLIETFIAAKPEASSVAPQRSEEEDHESRERTIRSLDRQTPHSLAEDFRYKRPIGFICGGVPFNGTTTWSQVYEALCRHFASLEPAVFEALPSSPDFVSDRGNRYFSRNASDLRIPRDFGGGVLAETNLSANQIRDLIRKILKTFGRNDNDFTVYLREDRDVAAGSMM